MDLAIGSLRNGFQAGCDGCRDLRSWFPRGRLHRASGRRLRYGRVRIGDAELGRVLKLPSPGHNDLQAVARHVRLQSSRRGPREFAGVWNVVAQTVDRDHIGGRTTEKHNGHRSWRSGLYMFGQYGPEERRLSEMIRTLQVMSKGLPAGTTCRTGAVMGLPLGFEPTGCWEQAEARPV